MSTDFLNELPSRLGSATHHSCGLFANIRRGPRYNEDFVKVTRNLNDSPFYLYYRVYNPSYLHSTDSPPLLVVHGGPSLPSDYLYPIADEMPRTRSIIFYDQLGCGKSAVSDHEDEQIFSMGDSVDDLCSLVTALGLTKFHLLGHSFGGCLAYEYIKEKQLHSTQCLSLTLANVPCNMKTSLEESCRIEEEITEELKHDQSDPGDQEPSKKSLAESIKEELRKRHECRTHVTPEPLVNAIERRGRSASWSTPEAVGDYVALPCDFSPTSSMDHSRPNLPPVLLIRGEFDFITEKCIEGWRKIFDKGPQSRGATYREEVMLNCAHYCHLEDGRAFVELVKSHIFIHDY